MSLTYRSLLEAFAEAQRREEHLRTCRSDNRRWNSDSAIADEAEAAMRGADAAMDEEIET